MTKPIAFVEKSGRERSHSFWLKAPKLDALGDEPLTDVGAIPLGQSLRQLALGAVMSSDERTLVRENVVAAVVEQESVPGDVLEAVVEEESAPGDVLEAVVEEESAPGDVSEAIVEEESAPEDDVDDEAVIRGGAVCIGCVEAGWIGRSKAERFDC